MPLLLIPLAFLILLALWLVLLPFSLWQRFRYGKSRRRVLPWLVGLNAWTLLATTVVFFVINAILQWWFPHNLLQAVAGWLAGVALGIVALWLARFERLHDGLYVTPNLWLVLALTLLVAARVIASFVQMFRQGSAWWSGEAISADWHSGLVAVAGLLLGYALAFQWGLRRRLRR